MSTCTRCGLEVSDNERFCPSCGYPVQRNHEDAAVVRVDDDAAVPDGSLSVSFKKMLDSWHRLQLRLKYLLILLPLILIGVLSPMLEENDVNIQGNSFANIASKGWAAVQGHWAYFSDNDGLYKMDSRDGSVKKLAEGHFGQLNVVGDWIYFNNFTGGSIRKITINGQDNSVLTVVDSLCYYLMVVDDHIYYDDGSGKLFMMDTSGGGKRQIASNAIVIGVDGSRLIVTDFDRQISDAAHEQIEQLRRIFSMEKDGSNKKLLFEIENTSIYRGIYIKDENFYYTTFNNGTAALKKIDMSTGKTSTILEKNATFCKLTNGWFYYESQSSEMFKTSLDGSSEKKIAAYLMEDSVTIDDWILYSDSGYFSSGVYRSKEDDSKKELINTKNAVEK